MGAYEDALAFLCYYCPGSDESRQVIVRNAEDNETRQIVLMRYNEPPPQSNYTLLLAPNNDKIYIITENN